MVTMPEQPGVVTGPAPIGAPKELRSRRGAAPLRPSRAVIRLVALLLVLALVAAGAGLLWQGGAGPFSFTTHRGQDTEIYGWGLYRDDTRFIGALNRGTDFVTLFLAIPLLAVSVLLYRRGSLRGGLLLMGALTWFLYVGASYALGAVAYNNLFLVYVALFSASLFAWALAFRSFNSDALPSRFARQMPRRRLAVFLYASSVLLLAVWLIEPITALVEGGPPKRLDIYSTLFTNALDMAVIVPTLVIAGVLILRRDPLGYLLAFPLFVFEMLLAPLITAQTLSQLRAGVSFTPGEIVGSIAGFMIFGLIGTWAVVAILRGIADAAPAPKS